MRFKLCIVLLASASLFACSQNPNRDVGTVAGAVVGGVIGNQIGRGTGRAFATSIGMMSGAIIGGNIGSHMDRQDRHYSHQALESYSDHSSKRWTNPNTGNSYTVTPTETYETASGPCRDYTTRAMIDGRPETVYGKACRQPDGSWQSVN